jgi:hypothetical protein
MRALFRLGAILCLQLAFSPMTGLCSSSVAEKDAQQRFRPTFRADKTSNTAKIDGELNDSTWRTASRITSFVERYPGDNTKPETPTEVLVTYDKEKLYVAFICHDDPATIRATMCQRDQFGGDDAVEVLIDTYGQAAWAYEFFVNPYGVQKDRLWSSVAGEDGGFDLIWVSAAKVTDSGYQAELAIPFASLRFPDQDAQVWRVDFWRIRPRESFHQYSWAAYNRNEQCFPCQWGTVEGIAGVRPGRGFELLPSLVAHQSGSLERPVNMHSRFDNGDIMGQSSLGAKYSLASDMTVEATYNPDFSQIESDAAQVDVNTTIALLYPERRPFFQEGADVFRTLFNSFYTRTVNDPQYAVKLVSRKPGFTLGFMSAQDENTPYMVPLEESSELINTGRSWVNALRGSRTVGESSQLGFILTDRRLEGGGYGTILAADGNIRLTKTLSVDGQFLSSFTGEPDKAGASADLEGVSVDQGKRTAVFDGESFHGNAFISRLKRSARHWGFVVDYNQVEPSYRTQTGYDPWVNYRNASLYTTYTFYPKGGLFERLEPQLYLDNRWRFDGVRRWEHQYLSLYGQMRWAQTGFTLQVNRGSEAWTSQATGAMISYDDLYGAHFDLNSHISSALAYAVSVDAGRAVALLPEATGNQMSYDVSLSLKPIDRLVIEPDINYTESRHVDTSMELFHQFIARTRFQVQLNREISLRLVLQYNDSRLVVPWITDSLGRALVLAGKTWDVDPLITYRLSPFSVLYFGSTHDYAHFPGDKDTAARWKLSSRQYFMKLQYLFRV